MDWKSAAFTYGSITKQVRAMPRDEWEAYLDRWRARAVEETREGGDARWHGFLSALEDEEDRRKDGTADTDPWLAEVLQYLYEREEHAQVSTGAA